MRNNLFVGNKLSAKFAEKTYLILMKREWVTFEQLTLDLELRSKKESPTSCKHKKVLVEAFKAVRETLCDVCGNDAIIEEGIKIKKYKYVGKEDNPLQGMLDAVFTNELEDYFQFCQDSTGFFPTSWIEHFFESTLDLFEIDRKKKQGKELMGSGMVRKHKNIDWLPFIYECIRDKKVLRVSYHEKFQVQSVVTFHPHFLKEFNGRWHIFGTIERVDEAGNILYKEGQNIPLDRIYTKPEPIKNGVCFKESETVKYPDYFLDIVGTTKTDEMKLYTITIRIHTRYMFGLMTTKPIHHTQRIKMEFDDEVGYGEVEMTLRPNNEFYGRVLQMGHDLEITSPKEVREEIARRINNMCARYNNN